MNSNAKKLKNNGSKKMCLNIDLQIRIEVTFLWLWVHHSTVSVQQS